MSLYTRLNQSPKVVDFFQSFSCWVHFSERTNEVPMMATSITSSSLATLTTLFPGSFSSLVLLAVILATIFHILSRKQNLPPGPWNLVPFLGHAPKYCVCSLQRCSALQVLSQSQSEIWECLLLHSPGNTFCYPEWQINLFVKLFKTPD